MELEPEIYKWIKAQKVAAANTAAIKELQQKVSAKKTLNGRGGNGKANGDSKVYQDCISCGKRHSGVCWDLEKADNSKKRSCKFLTRVDAKQYMKMALAKERRKHDSDSSGSDSSVTSWRRIE